jgi:signal transduction histidine kinase
VLDRIVSVARDVIGARYAALAVWEDDRIDDFITSGITAREILLIGDLPKGHGLLGAVLQEGRTIRLPDLAADSRSSGFPVNHPPMTSFLGVPVDYKGDIIGHLYLTEKRDSAEFTDEDELLASGIAALAATAMMNARWAEAEQQRVADLMELDRLRRDFVAIASHELASPTTILVGFLETLVEQWEGLSEDDRQDFVGRALRNGRELVSRLETALDLSRVEEGRLQIDGEVFDLTSIVPDVANLLTLAEQERLDVTSTSAFCYGDRRRLLRVAHNLISNAFKYSDETSPVTVRVGPARDGAELVVVDKGRGFEHEESELLFQRYYRSDAGMVDRVKGVGLGLYVSREIVHAHGGEITARSPGAGGGATFRVWIPAPEAALEQAPA